MLEARDRKQKGEITAPELREVEDAAIRKKDAIKRRIEEARRIVPMEDLAFSPQRGFSSTVEGNRITQADEINKLRLVVDVAEEVWGWEVWS